MQNDLRSTVNAMINGLGHTAVVGVSTTVGYAHKNAGHRFGLPRCKAFFGLNASLVGFSSGSLIGITFDAASG